jgi:hypothetical protein
LSATRNRRTARTEEYLQSKFHFLFNFFFAEVLEGGEQSQMFSSKEIKKQV